MVISFRMSHTNYSFYRNTNTGRMDWLNESTIFILLVVYVRQHHHDQSSQKRTWTQLLQFKALVMLSSAEICGVFADSLPLSMHQLTTELPQEIRVVLNDHPKLYIPAIKKSKRHFMTFYITKQDHIVARLVLTIIYALLSCFLKISLTGKFFSETK